MSTHSENERNKAFNVGADGMSVQGRQPSQPGQPGQPVQPEQLGQPNPLHSSMLPRVPGGAGSAQPQRSNTPHSRSAASRAANGQYDRQPLPTNGIPRIEASNAPHSRSAANRAAEGQYAHSSESVGSDRERSGNRTQVSSGHQPHRSAPNATHNTGTFQQQRTGAFEQQRSGAFQPSFEASRTNEQASAVDGLPTQSQGQNAGQKPGAQPGVQPDSQPGAHPQPSHNPQQGQSVRQQQAGQRPRHRQDGARPQRRAPQNGNGRRRGKPTGPQRGAHIAGDYVKPATPTPHVNGANGGRYVPMAVNSAHGKHPARRSKKPLAIILCVAVVAVIGLGIYGYNLWTNNKPVDVTINGETYTVNGEERVISGILDGGMVKVTPGDYVAIDESVITTGKGNRADVKINGEPAALDTRLWGGEEVEITDGSDIMEPYTDSNEQTIPHTMKVEGVGAYHVFQNEGKDGTKVTRTGNDSGISLDIVREEPEDRILKYYNTHTNGDKVICLTIDDGPWDQTTEQILDILKENDAHATFYTIGNQIQYHKDIVKRAADEGNEIATHTWDHAEGSGQGVSLNYMSPEERKQEVEKGLQAIRDAGVEPSVYFRAPGGNFDESVASDLSGLVMGEMGWNIDTQDWRRPGAQAIADAIMRLDPGEMALMHDGGGNREQTVEALRIAIPALKAQGFEFITVSEMIERYPYQEGQENPGTMVAQA